MKSQDTNTDIEGNRSPIMNLYEVTIGEMKMEICGYDAKDAKDAIVDWLDKNTTDYTIKRFTSKGRAW